jgi:hypothetical protein
MDQRAVVECIEVLRPIRTRSLQAARRSIGGATDPLDRPQDGALAVEHDGRGSSARRTKALWPDRPRRVAQLSADHIMRNNVGVRAAPIAASRPTSSTCR